MKNGNHAKGLNKRSIALVAAVALMLVGVIGGTIAWLTAETTPVTNTFTPTTLSVGLDEEHKGPYTMVPGCDITKDPKVTYSTDVDAYVFVKVDASTNAANFLTYSIADGWEKVDGVDNVYYKAVSPGVVVAPNGISVLAGDKVTVNGDVTKAMMDELKTDGVNPTLTFTAYIIQQATGNNADGTVETFTPEDAWAELNKTPTTT